MKTITVIDKNTTFADSLKSIDEISKFNVILKNSSIEGLKSFDNNIAFLFLSCDTEDINDFVVFDFLKKSENAEIPCCITYSESSQKICDQVSKLNLKPAAYLKIPAPLDAIQKVIKENLLNVPEINQNTNKSSTDVFPQSESNLDEENLFDLEIELDDNESDFLSEISEVKEEKPKAEVQKPAPVPKREESSILDKTETQVLLKQNQDLMQRLKDSQKEISVFSQENESLKDQIGKIESNYSKKLKTLEQELSSLKEINIKNESQKNEEEKVFVDEINKLKSEVFDLKKDNEATKNDNLTLKNDNVVLQTRVDQKENESKATLEKITNENNDKLKALLDKHSSDLKEINDKNELYEHKIQSLEDEVTGLEKKLSSSEEHELELNKKLEDKTLIQNELEKKNQAMSEVIVSMESKSAALKQEKDSLIEELTSLRTSNSETINSLSSIIEKLKPSVENNTIEF